MEVVEATIPQVSGIHGKIVSIMNKIGYIQKDGKIEQGGNYGYLSEEKLTTELHQKFAEEGLTIHCCSNELLSEKEYTTNRGGNLHNVRIKATYQITDMDSGESISVTAFGEGSDSGDKALNKAMTGSYKYALRQTLMISTGDSDDPDAVRPEYDGEPVQATPPPARRTAPATPAPQTAPATTQGRSPFARGGTSGAGRGGQTAGGRSRSKSNPDDPMLKCQLDYLTGVYPDGVDESLTIEGASKLIRQFIAQSVENPPTDKQLSLYCNLMEQRGEPIGEELDTMTFPQITEAINGLMSAK